MQVNHVLCTKYLWTKQKEMRILMMGLENLGKSTILNQIGNGTIITTIPTIGFNVETIEHKNISFTCWSVVGQDRIRPLYSHYYQNTQGLIWVIDASNHDTMQEEHTGHCDYTCPNLHHHLGEDELR